jgi:hypothetical protein
MGKILFLVGYVLLVSVLLATNNVSQWLGVPCMATTCFYLGILIAEDTQKRSKNNA